MLFTHLSHEPARGRVSVTPSVFPLLLSSFPRHPSTHPSIHLQWHLDRAAVHGQLMPHIEGISVQVSGSDLHLPYMRFEQVNYYLSVESRHSPGKLTCHVDRDSQPDRQMEDTSRSAFADAAARVFPSAEWRQRAPGRAVRRMAVTARRNVEYRRPRAGRRTPQRGGWKESGVRAVAKLR